MYSAYAIYESDMKGYRFSPLELDYKTEIALYPTWVIECDDKIVGGLTMMFESPHASIVNIAVHLSFQGFRLSAKLMDFADAQARAKQYQKLRLATYVRLTEYLLVYKHMSWQVYDRDEVSVYLQKNYRPARIKNEY